MTDTTSPKDAKANPPVTRARVASWMFAYMVLYSCGAALFVFFAGADFFPMTLSDGVFKTLLIGLFAQNIVFGAGAAYLATKLD